MPEMLLRRAFVVGCQLVVRSGQREIVMLAVPVHNRQATAFSEVSHRGPGKCMYGLGYLCLGAVSRSDKQKYPVFAVDMRCLKAEGIQNILQLLQAA